MFAKKYLDEYYASCKLFVWYMPYSRMDRKIEGDLFTLKYICDFINWLNFKRVIVMEPHSDKTLIMLNKNAVAVYPIKDWLPRVQLGIGFGENDRIVLPDKGAVNRYADENIKDICIIEKRRNPITCSIEDMYLKEGSVPAGSKCIIVDDLCSRGGTALRAAKILKERGAGEVFLAVSHLEEAAFKGEILSDYSPINAIFATKSMTSKEHPKVNYIDIDLNEYWNS